MQTKNLAELYDLKPLDWNDVLAAIDAGIPQGPGTGGPNRHTCWLATIDPDGAPHVTGVGAMWRDGAFWLSTGENSRKGKNLARDSRCTLSVATDDYDLVLEANAIKVTDPSTVAAIAAAYADDGWPARVDESGTAR